MEKDIEFHNGVVEEITENMVSEVNYRLKDSFGKSHEVKYTKTRGWLFRLQSSDDYKHWFPIHVSAKDFEQHFWKVVDTVLREEWKKLKIE